MTQGYIAALCAVVFVAGYLTGYTRGEAFGLRTETKTVVEAVQYPPAWASRCVAMIDAATGEPPDLAAPPPSPHLP